MVVEREEGLGLSIVNWFIQHGTLSDCSSTLFLSLSLYLRPYGSLSPSGCVHPFVDAWGKSFWDQSNP
jgi:hypothetical protein